MIRWLLPLTISLYLADVLFIVLGCVEADWLVFCYYGLIIVSLAFALLNAVLAVISKKTPLTAAVRNGMIFKLVLVPHYLMTFVVSLILLVFGLLSVFSLFWLASLPILLIVFLVFCFTFLMMISVSVWNIAALVRERKKFHPLFVIVNAVLQCIFVLDVFDTVYLYIALRKPQDASLPGESEAPFGGSAQQFR